MYKMNQVTTIIVFEVLRFSFINLSSIFVEKNSKQIYDRILVL